MRLLLVFLVVGLLFWWVGRRKSTPGTSKPADAANEQSAAPSGATAERMVSCARCGLHLPLVDALPSGQGRWACRAEHQEPAA